MGVGSCQMMFQLFGGIIYPMWGIDYPSRHQHSHRYTIPLESDIPGEIKMKCSLCQDVIVIHIVSDQPSEEERLKGA